MPSYSTTRSPSNSYTRERVIYTTTVGYFTQCNYIFLMKSIFEPYLLHDLLRLILIDLLFYITSPLFQQLHFSHITAGALFIIHEHKDNCFVCLFVFCPTREFFTHIETSPRPVKSCKLVRILFVCLGFFRPTREFFTHMETLTIAGEGLQILTYARHLWP